MPREANSTQSSSEPLNDEEDLDRRILSHLARAATANARTPSTVADCVIADKHDVKVAMTRLENEGRLERYMGHRPTMLGHDYLKSLNRRNR